MSNAIALLNEEHEKLRIAIFQSGMAFDFILFKIAQGCDKFPGVCSFNLTDLSFKVKAMVKERFGKASYRTCFQYLMQLALFTVT